LYRSGVSETKKGGNELEEEKGKEEEERKEAGKEK
jgi:hypothetical protein